MHRSGSALHVGLDLLLAPLPVLPPQFLFQELWARTFHQPAKRGNCGVPVRGVCDNEYGEGSLTPAATLSLRHLWRQARKQFGVRTKLGVAQEGALRGSVPVNGKLGMPDKLLTQIASRILDM